jgi:hypothetical protein
MLNSDPRRKVTGMVTPHHSMPDDEVDQLMLNARLRDELEPYLDESVELVNVRNMPTRDENEFLASMLEWERAPVLPISQWFQPKLNLPSPESLDNQQLHEVLWKIVHALFAKQIVLDFTHHLSDCELYRLICRDILPSLEKKIERRRTYLHWLCLDPDSEADVWLRYYASEEEREGWSEETGAELPPSELPPYPRRVPRGPMD